MSLFASITPIPKLLNNWNIWFRSVKLTMTSLNLWKFCIYSEEIVVDIASLNRAMAIILGSLTEVDANLVMSCETPYTMLNALKIKYEGSKSSNIMSLKGDFHTLSYDDDLSFFGRIREINAKLMSLGSVLMKWICASGDVVVTDRFYADSGASSHIVNNRNWLVNFRDCDETFDTADGQIKVLGYGDLNCECFTGTFWHNVTIRNVAYAKQKYNLISVGQIERTNENCSVVFCSGRMSVVKNGECMLTGYRSSELNNIYFLSIRIVSILADSGNVSLVSASLDDLALLHERFCHVNKNTIVKMAKSKVVNGLTNIVYDNVGFCDACSDGKLIDVSHRSSVKSVHVKPGQSIHIDIAGYTSEQSIHGNRYYLICVDECSSFVKVEFLKSLDQSCNLDDELNIKSEDEDVAVKEDDYSDAIENLSKRGRPLGSTNKKYENENDFIIDYNPKNSLQQIDISEMKFSNRTEMVAASNEENIEPYEEEILFIFGNQIKNINI
ncbi:hypothetical protein DERP_004270 [Dermatophagoides pteronyssinus]|uniref:Uncharacterized protein n=1 Tax=Dermatophagoides pteronyssinus TaxID=6956 RepID=A0ABQ8J8L3_DERPT|nr:hypothetical protein DERP_004270 [Dermatophagoides pteronyssinus]